ncbi:filamentous hemagglutinin N-terminal domain-containing protein [Rivularia sp. PCC 7116]|uniref:two-partner secretion domain-containing protein n=1 Tax=Rivularia sp. PCC 7116 TaxID=373994 RepID=UPI0002DBA75A|nr:filamentous hemagglutinin N-terminal domain-containing protein [Rivularia sp. PCC 7116]
MRKLSNLNWCIFSIASLCAIVSSINKVSAQVIRDETLPKNSEVKVEGNISTIEGGTKSNGNLFHSFKEFSVPTGNEAHFNNAADIQNIITRVTGKSISDIDGLIKANGTANLFLINPNGIVFGENAKLDIGGSFVGSTADSIKFDGDIEFNAINPENKPLLTVNVPLGLQYAQNPGKIEFKGKGEPERKIPRVIEAKTGLEVPANKTLALLGGDVLLEGATLKASSGRIELGSVTGESLVSIAAIEKGFGFGFEKLANIGEKFGDIRLSQNTAVDASGNGAGDIRVTSKNFTITDNSVVVSTQTGTEKSGSIVINAKESVNFDGINDTFIPSGLYANNVSKNRTENTGNIRINAPQFIVNNRATIGANAWSAGNGGDIDIKTNDLRVEGGGIVSAAVFGNGNGGNVNIDASNVQILGTSNDGKSFSELSVSAKKNSTGNTGNMNINTSNLEVAGGALIFAGTSGEGNGGDMTINATESIKIIGRGGNENQFTSGLFVVANEEATGNSGSLTINTNKMQVENFAFVSASNNGKGNAGDLQITTNELLIKDDASLISGVESENKLAGQLTIKTGKLLIEGGSRVNAGATSSDKVNLDIDAQEIQVIGTGNNGKTPSQLSILIQDNLISNAGELNIVTNTLLIKDGAFLFTGTSGKGNGGNLTINAEDIQVIGFGGNNPDNNNQPYFSGLFATAEKNSIGNAGKLNINTKRMLVEDRAFVSTSTNSNNGDGGDLNINANNLQVRNDSKVVSETNSKGTGGNLKITTNNLLVENGGKVSSGTSGAGNAGNLTIDSDAIKVKNDEAQITVESQGRGNAGVLTLNARSINLDNNALLNASTQSSDSSKEQATININSRDLILHRRSNIFTNAKGEQVIGGNINIKTDFLIAGENSDISANSENFRGGNVRIDAQGIFGTEFRDRPSDSTSDITATGASPDLAGIVEIITPQSDPNNGLVELPTIPIYPEIADTCSTPSYAQSSFTITGAGSLPPSPFKPLTGNLNRTSLVTLAGEIKPPVRRSRQAPKQKQEIKQIVDAQGWVRTKDGKIILVKNATQNSNFLAMKNSAHCN